MSLQTERMPAPDVVEAGAEPRQRGRLHVGSGRRGVTAMKTRSENLGQLPVPMKMFRDPDPVLARRQHQEIGEDSLPRVLHIAVRDPDTTSQAEAFDPLVVEDDEGAAPENDRRDAAEEDPKPNTRIPSGTWAANEATARTPMKAVEPPWSQTHHRASEYRRSPATGSSPRSARRI